MNIQKNSQILLLIKGMLLAVFCIPVHASPHDDANMHVFDQIERKINEFYSEQNGHISQDKDVISYIRHNGSAAEKLQYMETLQDNIMRDQYGPYMQNVGQLKASLSEMANKLPDDMKKKIADDLDQRDLHVAGLYSDVLSATNELISLFNSQARQGRLETQLETAQMEQIFQSLGL